VALAKPSAEWQQSVLAGGLTRILLTASCSRQVEAAFDQRCPWQASKDPEEGLAGIVLSQGAEGQSQATRNERRHLWTPCMELHTTDSGLLFIIKLKPADKASIYLKHAH
jgi:hypothetical protein